VWNRLNRGKVRSYLPQDGTRKLELKGDLLIMSRYLTRRGRATLFTLGVAGVSCKRVREGVPLNSYSPPRKKGVGAAINQLAGQFIRADREKTC